LIFDQFADMQHASVMGRPTVDVLTGIDRVDRTEWQAVLSRGDSNVVFLTSEWQRAWWDAYGRGRLLLVTVRRDGELIALASLFAEDGFIYFVGSGGSDYLDFIGDISCPQVIDSLLLAARSQVEDFIGFRFYLVPARSRTADFLERAAERLGMEFCDEGEIEAPFLDLTAPGAAHAAVNKKSLLRHERFFERAERIDVREMRRSEDILPHLDDFFAQHVRRWESTEWPSPFPTPDGCASRVLSGRVGRSPHILDSVTTAVTSGTSRHSRSTWRVIHLEKSCCGGFSCPRLMRKPRHLISVSATKHSSSVSQPPFRW